MAQVMDAALTMPPTLARLAQTPTTAGRLRWVLPTADGVAVRDDVPAELVDDAVRGILAGVGA